MVDADVHDVSRLPSSGDNTAIATRRLPAGTRIAIGDTVVTTDYTILEGHRFAVAPIPVGGALRSWGLRFGNALVDIAPGQYVHNARMLQALLLREVAFPLPTTPNFRDTSLEPYTLDPTTFQPGMPTTRLPEEQRHWFDGYDRGPERGVGIRNHIVILSTTSRTSSWAKALEDRLQDIGEQMGIDRVVAVSHTEGGAGTPNNLGLLLRTLAGFVVHPNVGAVLIVDHGDEAVTGAMLRRWMIEHNAPLDHVLHRFVTLRDTFEADLERGEALIRSWVRPVAATSRTRQPLASLKLGLQCGGSDAFSGVSGNPLAAWAARAVIANGGAANLAETDELIGAEEYVLSNVRDIETAERFLEQIERFKERVGWHGHTAEGNPSGGNLYRGLYNIAIKSIGAAMKRDPNVRLDHVIDYAEPMHEPGFYFMDSPGNDLESIAGQVASGSNLMLFVTGNGSITNFPFVPTLKIVTTTERFTLLADDMDINAGAYLDGTPMDTLGAQLVNRIVNVASGQRTKGERAGHAQVSIWRDWPQTGPVDVAAMAETVEPDGTPLLDRATLAAQELTATERELAVRTFTGFDTPEGVVIDRIGLVLPTSLCSGEIARRIAEVLNVRHAADRDHVPSRYVALPHTEGCGVSSGASENLFVRTLLGHLLHPMVESALLLEHGCEKTHNDYLRAELRQRGIDLDRFGWASIQLDGGIDSVLERACDWFDARRVQSRSSVSRATSGLDAMRLGLAAIGPQPPELTAALTTVTRAIVSAGGTVVVPAAAPILSDPAAWRDDLGVSVDGPSLQYAAISTAPGLHLMDCPTSHWVEVLTGLAASGVELVLAASADRPVQGHRMVPVLQVTTGDTSTGPYRSDFDLILDGDPALWPETLLSRVLRAAERTYRPRLMEAGNIGFQITRGLLGVSM